MAVKGDRCMFGHKRLTMGAARPVAARRERMMAPVFILMKVITLEIELDSRLLYGE